MRVLFMGTPQIAVGALDALHENHEVVGVFTQPDKPKGRGGAVTFSPVKEAALQYGIPIFQPAKIRDGQAAKQIRQLKPDVAVVIAYGQILPEEILQIPPYGCINIHASLLPKYRGAAPIQWAVMNGEEETGLTTMYMEKGLDTGDMILTSKVKIAEDETGKSLHDKLAALSGPLILDTLRQVEDGTAPRISQDDSLSSYAPMLTKELGRIDWAKDAASIERLVRGLNSWPSAYTAWKGKTLKIWESQAVEASGKEAPGTVIGKDKASFTVKCGQGALRILSVQLPGKKRMEAKAFLAGNPADLGMRLG